MTSIRYLTGVLMLTSAYAAPVIYTADALWTGDPATGGNALVIDGERIVAVGDADALTKSYPDARRVLTGGKMIIPGLIDNHVHFMDGAGTLVAINTLSASTKADFIKTIGDHAKGLPKGKWITGGIWDHELWGGELPDRAWIDAMTPDNPLIILRTEGHTGFANSAALKAAGIDRNTPDPVGGRIVRRADGEPTGILLDNAMDAVFKVVPAPTKEEEDRTFDVGVEYALAHGVTQVHDVSPIATLPPYQRAKAEGRLKIRAAFYPMSDARHDIKAYTDRQGKGDDWLRYPGVKLLSDGAIGSATAWFYDPYLGRKDDRGFPLMPEAEMEKRIREIDANGQQLAIHAIGDKANDFVLDVFEKIGVKGKRARVEHAQHMRVSTIKRMHDLGVIASMQPWHAVDDGRFMHKLLDPVRLKEAYPFKTVIDEGVTLTFGSDWPVAPLDPLGGIYAAVTRRTLDGKNPDGWQPQEKISVSDALRSYTVNNAYAGWQEDRLGSLTPGKLADFVVLDQNLLTIDPVKIHDTRVLMTIVGGKVMYLAK